VNQPRTQILDIAGAVPLTAVQFHGDEDDGDVAAFPWRVIRAVSLETSGSEDRIAQLPGHVTVLLDAFDPHRRGGTGKITNWAQAALIAETRPIVLAGGLLPSNIAEAVRTVRPWGVDVSSGVEASPGIKDHQKLTAFVAALEAGGRALELDPPGAPARGGEMSGASI
jgi:phosphoribosylanthranilate isomerase